MARKRKKSKAKKGVKSAEAVERAETSTGSTETAGTTKKSAATKKGATKKGAAAKKGAAKKKSATAKKGAAKRKSAPAKKGATKKSAPESKRDDDVATLDIEDDGVDENVAALVASVAVEDGEEIISLDDDEGAVEEVAVISIDDEEDDASAREQLIAETLALAAAEGGETGADSRHPTAESAESGPREPDEDSSDMGAVEEPVPDGGDPAPTAEERSVPLLTPAALLALSEMRHGDIGTLGAELILDLGEGTTPEERDRILSAALAQVEMQEAIYRVPTETGMADRGKGTIALLLMLMALYVSVRPPDLVIPEPPAQLVAADQIYGTRVALLLQVQQIEAYRIREQRLPESLGEVAVVLPGVRFVKSSSRLYQLIAHTPEGVTIVYDSASPAQDFERISRSWTTTRDAS